MRMSTGAGAGGGGRANASSPAPSRLLPAAAASGATAGPAGRPVPTSLPTAAASGTSFPGATAATAVAAGSSWCVPRLLRPLVLICDLDDTLVGGELDMSGGADGGGGSGKKAARWSTQQCNAHSAQLAAALDTWRQRWRQQQAQQGLCQKEGGAASGPRAGGAGGSGGGSGAHPPCWFVVNTGRTLPLFLAAQRERCGLLAQPDVLICGVGTRMYTPAPAAAASAVMEPPEPTPAAAAPEDAVTGQQCDWQWVEHKAWAEHVEGLVGSNGGSSGGSSDDLAAEDGEEGADWHIGQVTVAVQEVMQRLGPDSLGWRGAEENESLKLTVTLAVGRLAPGLVALDAALAGRGVRYRLVVGPSDEPGPGWAYADILPVRAGKLAAATYAAQWLLRLERTGACGGDCSAMAPATRASGSAQDSRTAQPLPPGLGLEAVVVAGDAPNDLDMLAGSPHASIAVANCHPTVRRFAAAAMAVEAPTAAASEAAAADRPAPGITGDGRGTLRSTQPHQPHLQPLQAAWDAGAAAVAGVAVATELGPQAGEAARLLLERWRDRHGCASDSSGGNSSGGSGGSNVCEGSGLSLSSMSTDCGSDGRSRVGTGGGGSGGNALRPRVHLARLPAAGGVLEGLRALGYVE